MVSFKLIMISRTNFIWGISAGVAIIILAIISVFAIWSFLLNGTTFFGWWKNEAVIINSSSIPSPSVSPEVQDVKLLFFGDLMFDRNIRQVAAKNGNDFIFAQIAPWLAENDLVVANLEGPITENKSVSLGSEPGSTNNFIFTFDSSLAGALFNNNIRLVNLGNNHILNFGQAGLESTKQYLNSAGVGYFGEPAGPSSISPNIKSVVKNIKGVKIAFINYNQFIGNASTEQITTIEEIKNIKAQADIVILYAHWGIEYDSAPNSAIKNLAHSFVEAGADLVIGSHPHVVQPSEEYLGKKIYYSLGNFVFDQYFSQAVKQGLGVIVKINSATKRLEFEEKKLLLQANGQTSLSE